MQTSLLKQDHSLKHFFTVLPTHALYDTGRSNSETCILRGCTLSGKRLKLHKHIGVTCLLLDTV